MLYDFLLLNRENGEPLCNQLYDGLRTGIQDGKLRAGEKLASIREASAALSVSRTTVETAYGRLCLEGFIEARPQSGYRVRQVQRSAGSPAVQEEQAPVYDFTTSSVEPEAADLLNWRKLVRAVLADELEVSSYGDPQGEMVLRQALSSYAFHARGVKAKPEQIFIGAGIGPLLQLLCPLLKTRPKVVMECPGFTQAQQIFTDYGFPVVVCEAGQAGLPEEAEAMMTELPSLRPYMQPSAVAAHRAALTEWVRGSPGRYVLEDDYNGELHYKTRAIPAVQGILPEKTIYLGSFSKLLLPSVRIAYMVLPEPLAELARGRLPMLNQTAGKTEQVALAEYIRSGLLEKHLRRLRRLYAKKSQVMAESLQEVFGWDCSYSLHETSLSFLADFQLEHWDADSAQRMVRAARTVGVACRPAPGAGTDPGHTQLILGFSGIPTAKIPDGIALLGRAWGPMLR